MDFYGLYVDINDTVYVPGRTRNRVLVWLKGNMTPARIISAGLNSPLSVIASISGDIYIDNSANNNHIDMWTPNATLGIEVMPIIDRCIGLAIDINDTLYCANDMKHQVVKMSLRDDLKRVSLAAGNGSSGNLPNLVNYPNGIFVDTNFDLYVADWGNDRIQLFPRGQSNAITVAGTGAPGTISLTSPSAIVLDADRYLFISDSNNHRVVRSGPYGFYCLFGCKRIPGSASNELNKPYALNFDSQGNLFVADLFNARVQKFLLKTNSCGKFEALL